jgi:hypothetical protein
MNGAKGGQARTDTLRKLAIQKVTHLGYKKWIMAYDCKQLYQSADDLYNQMMKASGALGMSVEEPEWFELPREDDIASFKN